MKKMTPNLSSRSMRRKITSESERDRKVVAQEAARIIVNQGVRDYRLAKQKAAERLGLNSRGALPSNAEIEKAVADYLKKLKAMNTLTYCASCAPPRYRQWNC